ncbi:MAG: hypothetical protein JJT95_08615 [Pararhodobacter sp.]|nr:hypothetical protein [Pararhodobacter sp.]
MNDPAQRSPQASLPPDSPRNDGMRMRAILTLAAAVGFVSFSFAAPEFRGYDPAQMPHGSERPPVQPAGFAFAIWGVIYLWLIVHGGYGLLARAEDAAWDRPRWPVIGAMALGAGWLWVAVANPLAATLMIFAMLALALWALARAPRRDPVRDFWLARAPLGLFAGWLTAASFVSAGLIASGYGLIGSERAAALVTIVLAAGFAAWVIIRLKPGGGYALAAGWGLFGIAVANVGQHIDIAALSLAGVLALAWLWWRGRTAAGTG